MVGTSGIFINLLKNISFPQNLFVGKFCVSEVDDPRSEALGVSKEWQREW